MEFQSSANSASITKADSVKFVRENLIFDGAVPKGLYVSFKDLCYTVQKWKSPTSWSKIELKLLQKVTAFVQPGVMTALMGPSGCGKTTLMDVLAGRKSTGTVSGEIYYGTSKPTLSFLRRHTGYVEQFDTLCDNLTVYENLMYTAEMKLPMEMPIAEKQERVNKLIEDLDLVKCRDTLIGNAQRKGVSGGQAKRVNIGVSLISDPKVLYLDEPTTGLDSFTSDELMKHVSKICANGLSVCATIHSPTPYCFHLFHSLLLLAGGLQVYFGPTSQDMVEYFQNGGLADNLELEHGAEAEWVITLVTGAEKDGRREEFVSMYSSSKLKAANDKQLEGVLIFLRGAAGEGMKLTVEDFDQDDLRKGKPTAVPTKWAITKMLKYRVLKNYQDGMFLSARIVDKLISLGIVMTLFQGLGGSTDPIDMNGVAAGLFMFATSPALTAGAYLPTIMLERPLYNRERADGLYYSFTYLIVKWIQEVVLVVPTSLILATLVYFSMGLNGLWVVYWLNYMLAMLTSIAFSYMIAVACPSFKFANSAVPFYGGTLLYFIGFLIPVNTMPGYWKWYAYLCQLRYPWSAMMATNFGENPGTFQDTNQTAIEFYGLEGVRAVVYTPAILPFLVTYILAGAVILKFVQYGTR